MRHLELLSAIPEIWFRVFSRLRYIQRLNRSFHVLYRPNIVPFESHSCVRVGFVVCVPLNGYGNGSARRQMIFPPLRPFRMGLDVWIMV